MPLKKHLNILNHHAYALIGSDSIRSDLMEILEKQHSIKIHGNADLYIQKYTNFSIENAREIKTAHLTRPITESGRKIFVLQMDSITVEAQNALLKLLEEPALYATFFIIIPSSHLLLTTVKSRLHLIQSSSAEERKTEMTDAELKIMDDANKFIIAKPAKRLEMIKSLMDDITKEKRTKQDAIDFLNAIQSAVYDKSGAIEGKSALKSIEIARKYMNDRSPSLKMLLEYVALNL